MLSEEMSKEILRGRAAYDLGKKPKGKLVDMVVELLDELKDKADLINAMAGTIDGLKRTVRELNGAVWALKKGNLSATHDEKQNHIVVRLDYSRVGREDFQAMAEYLVRDLMAGDASLRKKGGLL